MTTDWFTASPTPLGPERGFSPRWAATTPAMNPKISALISLIYRSGAWARAEKLARNDPGVPCCR
jgi:hypothetical protein